MGEYLEFFVRQMSTDNTQRFSIFRKVQNTMTYFNCLIVDTNQFIIAV